MDAFDDSAASAGGVTAEMFDDLADMVAELPDDRQRQLLDDLSKAIQKPAKPPKNGSVKFDDRIIAKKIGELVRLFNDRANALGLQRSKGFADLLERCDHLETSWNRWQLELEKK